jgi:hypothetical protein
MFLRKDKDGSIEIICVYVDDYLVAAKTKQQVDDIFNDLMKEIKMKRQGELHYLLGVKIIRDRKNRTLHLSQEAAINRILDKFNLSNCQPKKTPEVAGQEDLWEDKTKSPSDQSIYRSMIGSMVYLMTCTRPDIAHAIQRLSRYLHCPRKPHDEGAKRVLRYLSATKSIGICFRASSLELVAYTDASWAPKPDRRSTSGFICTLAQGPVSWRSRRQRITALSSCESEYISLADGSREVTWLRNLCKEIGLPQGTTTIHCDNQSAIATADTVSTTDRSKHIDIRYHYIREQIQSKDIKVSYLPTIEMLADILTKCSTNDAIEKFRNALMTRQASG